MKEKKIHSGMDRKQSLQKIQNRFPNSGHKQQEDIQRRRMIAMEFDGKQERREHKQNYSKSKILFLNKELER